MLMVFLGLVVVFVRGVVTQHEINTGGRRSVGEVHGSCRARFGETFWRAFTRGVEAALPHRKGLIK